MSSALLRQSNSSPNGCPSVDDLACFIEKRAQPDAAEHILAHLDECENCRLLLAATLRESQLELDATNALASTPRTFPIGEVVGGRYRIKCMISRGGMGEVYEAWDVQLSESVALKTIVCTGLDNAALYVRIRKEVQLARKVTHPNVCRILEFGLHQQSYRSQTEVIPFFTMELLSGSTLADYVARRGKVPTAELFPIVAQVLNGLAAIHAAGIVHRDLKPENIIILDNAVGDVRVVVMDFGLARIQDNRSSVTESSSNSTVGTPSYMAPEQALGGTPSVAWDIYSFGVVLFRVIAGELPFTGNNAVALAMARVQNRARALSSVVPDVDPDLENIVARCLERNPAHRYASVEEIQRAMAHRQSRWLRRRSVRALKMVALVVGIGAGAATAAWLLLRQPLYREVNAGKIESKMFLSGSLVQNPHQPPTSSEPPQRRSEVVEGLSEPLRGTTMPEDEHETESTRQLTAGRSSAAGAVGTSVPTHRAVARQVSTASAKRKPSSGNAAPLVSRSTGAPTPRMQIEDDIAIPAFVGPALPSRGKP